MRCYTFSIAYLSSIQQGIQGAHAITELFLKYRDPQHKVGKYLYEWAEQHKTMICLNAGDFSQLSYLHRYFVNYAHLYPWAAFNESEQALNDIMTSIAIVLPEHIYNHKLHCEPMSEPYDNLLAQKISEYHLAR
jgi:hypothetical protein